MFHRAVKNNKRSTFLWTAVSRVILFLHSSIVSSNNKEYLTAAFKHWLSSRNEFFSKHFAKNCMPLWCMVAKLWYHKLCAIFWGPPRIMFICTVSATKLTKNSKLQNFVTSAIQHPYHACCAPDVCWRSIPRTDQHLQTPILACLDVFRKMMILQQTIHSSHASANRCQHQQQCSMSLQSSQLCYTNITK